MTAKLKLGGWVLCFLLFAGTAANLTPMQPGWNSEYKVQVPRPVPLSSEQKALVEHLSSKYTKPLALVERIVRAAYREARRNELPPTLVLAIIEKESSLKPESVNYYGAMGLMQVVPRFHTDKLEDVESKEELLTPETNIRVGTQILAEYITSKQGNIPRALKKYSGNARDYFKRVAAYRKRLDKVRAEANAMA